MPAGTPVATFAIGEPGAVNAALFALQMLAHDDADLRARLASYRRDRHDDAASSTLPPA
jgi:5-(carboxyamino)imidazole ribonucleotide mutase